MIRCLTEWQIKQPLDLARECARVWPAASRGADTPFSTPATGPGAGLPSATEDRASDAPVLWVSFPEQPASRLAAPAASRRRTAGCRERILDIIWRNSLRANVSSHENFLLAGPERHPDGCGKGNGRPAQGAGGRKPCAKAAVRPDATDGPDQEAPLAPDAVLLLAPVLGAADSIGAEEAVPDDELGVAAAEEAAAAEDSVVAEPLWAGALSCFLAHALARAMTPAMRITRATGLILLTSNMVLSP